MEVSLEVSFGYDILVFIKVNDFPSLKDTLKNQKAGLKPGEKFASNTSDKRLETSIWKEFLKFNN